MHISTRTVLGLAGIVIVAAAVLFVSPQVGQGAASRVPVRVGDKIVGTPFTQEIPVTIPAGSINASGTSFIVPADKVLQIEFISVQVLTDSGAANTTNFVLNTSLGGNAHSHRLLMAKQGFALGGDLFLAGQKVSIYAQGESAVNATIGRDNNISSAASATVTVTGRLFEQ